MARTYVPGYGYVDSNDPGTRGSVGSGPKRRDTGQAPRPQPAQASTGGVASVGDHWNNRDRSVITGDGTTVSGSSFTPRPTEGVAFPLSGYGGFGQLRGYEFGQRMGPSPDALELFPYGVAYRTQAEATDSFLELDPGYQAHLKKLAQHPNIGTSGSTGRMLWERLTRLAAERTAMGRPASPQMLAAELAYSLGVSPMEGRDGSDEGSSGGGSSYYSGGGGGYGGGGGGGGGSVSLTNPTSARGLLMQTMQSVLGRNPTNDEYKTFLQVLNEAEMANPNTASVEGDVVVGSGGVDPGVLALEFAQDQEDFTERQGDRYFRTFMQALAGGV